MFAKKMKILHLLALLLLCSTSAYSEDLTTIGGKIYTGITIKEITPCEIKIFHSSGVASIVTGDIPDEFLKSHEIPFDRCPEFESERQLALDERRFQDFIASNTEIILPDGTASNSSKIIGYDPTRVVFRFPGGPRGIDPRQLPESVRVATGYSDKAAAEFRAFLREQEKIRDAQIARLQEAQRMRKLAKDRQDELDRLLRSSVSDYGSTRGGSYGSVWVRGYYRKDGTYVRGHSRSR